MEAALQPFPSIMDKIRQRAADLWKDYSVWQNWSYESPLSENHAAGICQWFEFSQSIFLCKKGNYKKIWGCRDWSTTLKERWGCCSTSTSEEQFNRPNRHNASQNFCESMISLPRKVLYIELSCIMVGGCEWAPRVLGLNHLPLFLHLRILKERSSSYMKLCLNIQAIEHLISNKFSGQMVPAYHRRLSQVLSLFGRPALMHLLTLWLEFGLRIMGLAQIKTSMKLISALLLVSSFHNMTSKGSFYALEGYTFEELMSAIGFCFR